MTSKVMGMSLQHFINEFVRMVLSPDKVEWKNKGPMP
jgi:hypothetical protein